MPETERPRSSQLSRKRVSRHLPPARLHAHKGMRKVDGHLEVERVGRRHLVLGIAHPVRERLQHREILGRPAAGRNTCPEQGIKEREGASVHDRRFGTVHVDVQIIDPCTRDGREDMFDRVKGVGAVSQLRLPLGKDSHAVTRRNSQPAAVGTHERDSRAAPRGTKHQPAVPSQVEPNALDRRFPCDRLTVRGHSRSAMSRSMRFTIPASLNRAAEALNDSRCGRAG